MSVRPGRLILEWHRPLRVMAVHAAASHVHLLMPGADDGC